MGKTNIRWGKGFHPSWVTYMKGHLGDYRTIVLSDRLFGYIKLLGDITAEDDIETGGFLIKTGVGVNTRSIGVRLVNLVKGEDREIILESQEELESGEEYIGTFHSHPVTDIPSVHDVITFLADPLEKMSIVRGVDGTVNLKVKTPATRPLAPDQIEAMKERYPKGDEGMGKLVRDFDFMFFQGKTDELERAYVMDTKPLSERISLDELALGVEGASHFPEATKKKPKKTQGLAEGESTEKTYFWHAKPDHKFNSVTRQWEKP